MDIKYRDDGLALVADLRSPYLALGNHPEWTTQFVKTIGCAKVHQKLTTKLANFKPFILCYTKIWPDISELRRLVGLPEASVCIISGVGEHNMTPWMIIHNIGHTYLSWRIKLKREIVKLLGLDPQHYSIVARQCELVKCGSARRGAIPNLNELIYELFTTWVWYGRTRSGHAALAACCDAAFRSAVADRCVVWHRYRPPTGMVESAPTWFSDLVTSFPLVCNKPS